MSFFSGIFGNHGYADTNTVTGMTGSTSQSAAAGQNQANGTLPSLSAGQTIEGKVIASNGNTVQIDIGTGTPITAKLDQAMNLQEGQNVIFEVKSNSSQQLTLSPLYTNLTQGATAWKALENANMPVNSASLEMTTAMMNAGMSIDKSSLSSMYHLVSNFPGREPTTIIQMHQMGLEINEQTISQFEAFKNYETQIGEGMKQIAADIPKMYEELLVLGKETDAAEFMKAVITAFLDEMSEMAKDGTGALELPGQNADLQDAGLQNAGEQDAGLQNAVLQESGLQDASVKEGISEAETKILENQADATEEIVATKNGEDNSDEVTGSSKGNLAAREFPGAENAKVFGAPIPASPEEVKDTVIRMMRETGMPEEQAARMEKQPATEQNILKMTRTLMELAESGTLPDEAAEKLKGQMKSLFLSGGFKNVLEDTVQKQWFLEPSAVADKETVENLYRRINQQTKNLTDTLSTMARPESALSQDLSNMNQNMNFMNQMNQMYQYIQLPLKMHGGEATGDLFVYSDRKSLAQNNGTVSALLHLDMQYLGMVDVYASMTEAKNVFTRFYLESDEMIDFIAENIHVLDERLKNRGYNLKTEMTRHEEKKDMLTEAVAKKDGVIPQTVAKYSFDMRA